MNEKVRLATCAIVLASVVALTGCASNRGRSDAAASAVLVALQECDWVNPAAPVDMGESALENIRLRSRAVQCDIAVEGVAEAIGVKR